MFLSPAFSAVQTAAVESAAALFRRSASRSAYERARCLADSSGRPLVIVGAGRCPCGDLPCVDPKGCDRCEATPSDVSLPGSIPAPDASAVVCVQFALEHVPDVEAAWAEVRRAAGSPRYVFVARLPGWASGHRLLAGCRRLLDDAPPNETGELVYHEVRSAGRGIMRGKPRRVL